MLTYAKLSGNARRFRTIMGMSLQEFDLLLAKVEKTHPETERDRLSKRSRKRAIGAGRRFALDLRNRVMLLLFYYRTYVTQDVAAEVFGVGQATVSRSIDQIASVVRQCIPIPAKIHDRAKRASTIEDLEEILPGLRCLIDASEQQVQRPKRKDMEKVPLFWQGREAHGQGTVRRERKRPDRPQHEALPGTSPRRQGVQDEAPDVSIRPAVPGRA